MHDLIRSHFEEIQKALSSTTIPEERRQVITNLIEKLPTLYTQYRETNSSRFGDEITRLVQAVLRELDTCPEAKKLESEFREGLQNLHAEFGIPRLSLKAPVASKSRKKTKS